MTAVVVALAGTGGILGTFAYLQHSHTRGRHARMVARDTIARDARARRRIEAGLDHRGLPQRDRRDRAQW